MRSRSIGIFCLLVSVLSFADRPLRAQAPAAQFYQLCLNLDSAVPTGHQFYLNFVSQGNGILVSGVRGHATIDDHGPVFGSLQWIPEPGRWEMGLTVTYQNSGDYDGPNTHFVVFRLPTTSPGVITYKQSVGGNEPFTQGLAYVCNPRPANS